MFIGVSNFKNFEIYYIKYSKLQYLLEDGSKQLSLVSKEMDYHC